MASKAAKNIPFTFTAESGFRSFCYTRTLSKNDISIVIPPLKGHGKLTPGMSAKLTMARFGNAPVTEIEGRIAAKEGVALEGGKAGVGLRIEFADVSEALVSSLQAYVQFCCSQSLPESFLAYGKLLFEKFLRGELNEGAAEGAALAFFHQLPPRLAKRIKKPIPPGEEGFADRICLDTVCVQGGMKALTALFQGRPGVETGLLAARIASETEATANALKELFPRLDPSDREGSREITLLLDRFETTGRECQAALTGRAVGQTRRDLLAETPSNAFDRLFLPLDAYRNALESGSLAAPLDACQSALLAQLRREISSELHLLSAMEEAGETLFRNLSALALKVAFEYRLLLAQRPLRSDAERIRPGYSACTALAGELNGNLTSIRAKYHEAKKRPDLSPLDRASLRVAKELGKMERLLTTLPLPADAERYYKAIENASRVAPPRREVPWRPIAALSIAALLAFLGFHYRDHASRLLSRPTVREEGSTLGIQSVSFWGNRWTGLTTIPVWEAIPLKIRTEKGEEFARRLLSGGFREVEIRDLSGTLLAKIERFGKETKWSIVENPKPSARGKGGRP